MNPWMTWLATGSPLDRQNRLELYGAGWDSPDAWGACRAWCILTTLARGMEVTWEDGGRAA